MKKVLLILLSFVFVFSFASCGSKKEIKMDNNDQDNTEENVNEITVDLINSLCGRWEEVPHRYSEVQRYVIYITKNDIKIYWFNSPPSGPEYEFLGEGKYSDPEEPFSECEFVLKCNKVVDGQPLTADGQPLVFERFFSYSQGILSFKPQRGIMDPIPINCMDPNTGDILPVKLQRVSDQPVQD